MTANNNSGHAPKIWKGRSEFNNDEMVVCLYCIIVCDHNNIFYYKKVLHTLFTHWLDIRNSIDEIF
jgi:hypothetical protein